MLRPARSIQDEPEPQEIPSEILWEIPAEPRHRRPVVRPPRQTRSLPWLRMSLMVGVAVAGLAYLAQHRGSSGPSDAGPVPPSSLTAPAPLWQPIVGPSAVYTVEVPDRTIPVVTEARRHAGGGREDTFVIGMAGAPDQGRLSLARGVSEPDASFYVDLVRRAAQAGLSVVRLSQSRSVATKFGTVETADAILAAGAEQACLAFRFAHPEISFGLRGWLCGSETRPVSDAQLACLLDRVSLVNGGDDAALKVLFAQADKRRGETCPQTARVATARKG